MIQGHRRHHPGDGPGLQKPSSTDGDIGLGIEISRKNLTQGLTADYHDSIAD